MSDDVGFWKIDCDGYYPYCSKCGAEPPNGAITKYCTNCGAKMMKFVSRIDLYHSNYNKETDRKEGN